MATACAGGRVKGLHAPCLPAVGEAGSCTLWTSLAVTLPCISPAPGSLLSPSLVRGIGFAVLRRDMHSPHSHHPTCTVVGKRALPSLLQLGAL